VADIAVVGTAAADVVLRVTEVPRPGEHVSASSLGWRLGGGSANVACALAADGQRVELVGPFSTDPMGDALLAELAGRGVGTARSFRVPAPSPRALILLDSSGERTIVGVDDAFSTQVYPLPDLPELGAVGAVYVETYSRFPTSIADHAPGALVMTKPPTHGERPWPADVLVGSEREYPAEWRAAPYERGREVAGERLRWVVVTRGPRGADAFGPGGVVHVDPRPVEQVDATGAGDAFAAGLMSGLLVGMGIEAALRRAADWGARSVATFRSVAPASIEALSGSWPQG
jgi:sugar/nucleoside kinase (ribokinase family)